MRILFVNPRGHLPQLLGGVETTTFDLCRQLALGGHQTAVMCQLGKYDSIWLRNRIANRLTGQAYPADRYRGTVVYRGYHSEQGLPEVMADFRPDALVVAAGHDDSFKLTTQCVQTGVTSALYVHDLNAFRVQQPELHPNLILLANSAYTARGVRDLVRRDSIVIPPLVDREAYRVTTSRRHVTMVNPRRVKGGEIAIQLAQACPDIPFVFVEAWHTNDAFVRGLRAAGRRLANVTWYKPRTDMRSIYGGTRVQLVPTQWEETWGRVVTEAHASAIPVLASTCAALPESVGPGGILVARDAPIDAWIRALRSMWDDQPLYDSLVAQVRTFSARPEAQPQYLAARFIAALQRAAVSARSVA